MSFSFDTGDQSPFGNTLALAPKLKYVFPRSGKLELVPHHRKLFHDQFTTKMNNVRSRIDFLCIRQVGPQANYSNRYVADKTRKLDVDAKICRRRRIVLGGNSVKGPDQRGFARTLLQNHAVAEQHTRRHGRRRQVALFHPSRIMSGRATGQKKTESAFEITICDLKMFRS